jgi:hypothetical protein
MGPTCQSPSLCTGPPVSASSPRDYHAPAPRLKGAVGTARVRPDSRPHPDHAPPPTVAVRSRATVRSRPRMFDVPLHRRRPATPAASAPVAAEPHVPTPSSTPHRPDAAIADFAGKSWCRRLRRAAVYTASSRRTASTHR